MSFPTLLRPRRTMAFAFALSAALAASACGSSSGTKANAAPTDHVLHLSFLQDPGQPPDPDIYYSGQGLLLTTNTYDGLLQYEAGTATPKIVSDLATSWTQSADHTVFTLQLRQGVKFHDGTPFTSAAVKPSFDRRLAVNQGPAYMVSDIKSVTATGDYGVTITLNHPNAVFLDYLASAYGPRMMSPTGLAAHAGSDNDQTYLQTHDLGTGPYTLSDAKTGTHYAMKAFADYWGKKPYFTDVDMPVETDASTVQLLFDKGQLAVIMHDISQSAVGSYKNNKKFVAYSLPTMNSDFVYVNPSTSFLTTPANRLAVLKAIDAQTILTQVFAGRATLATQVYPAHMVPAGQAMQNIPHDTAALTALLKTLPANQKTITVGYDSGVSDNQLVANLVSAQLGAIGLTVKVQAYPTSQIFGWVSSPKGAPDLLLATGWPDAAPPYMWSHISFDPEAGLNYLHCSDPQVTKLDAEGLVSGDAKVFEQVAQLAAATGCWDNLVNEDDFMVAQPWLKGVVEAHVVGAPTTLSVAALSVG
ncbi:MAG: peptide/nickel transport system substrate-binding protein [Actinomycetota bacterium]|nr:peptide/nickel transport system substrate-binding protein [Actinomycetota bacterium]